MEGQVEFGRMASCLDTERVLFLAVSRPKAETVPEPKAEKNRLGCITAAPHPYWRPCISVISTFGASSGGGGLEWDVQERRLPSFVRRRKRMSRKRNGDPVWFLCGIEAWDFLPNSADALH